MPIALVAVGGAAYTLLTRRVKPEKVYREIDWGLLVLFIGLFVVIGGVEETRPGRRGLGLGLPRSGLHRPLVLTVVTAVLSNLVSNVPGGAALQDRDPGLRRAGARVALLAMASTLAGNLTILGSVANLIVVEAAREERIAIGFWEYARVGIPITLVTLVFGWAILVLLPACRLASRCAVSGRSAPMRVTMSRSRHRDAHGVGRSAASPRAWSATLRGSSGSARASRRGTPTPA